MYFVFEWFPSICFMIYKLVLFRLIRQFVSLKYGLWDIQCFIYSQVDGKEIVGREGESLLDIFLSLTFPLSIVI